MRFERDFTFEERSFAQGILEKQAIRSTVGCAMMVVFWSVFVVAKVATIQVSFIFLPLVLFAIALHNLAGIRFWRVRKGARLVVWLRRFHRQDLRRFPFGALLQGACNHLATPITIQDSTYRLSWNSLVARGVFTMLAVFVGAVLAGITIVAIGVTLLYFAMETCRVPEQARVIVTGIAVLVGGPVLIVWFVRWISRRACYRRLKPSNYGKRMESLIRRIERGKSTFALQVVQCGDDFWKAVVQQALKSADAVVVDVTELNENVRWELSQISAIVAPERVVLCCAARMGQLPIDESVLLANLVETFGRDEFERMHRVTYSVPAALPGWIEFFDQRIRDFGAFAALRNLKDNLNLHLALILAVHAGKFSG
jgi:hypothetical protein